MVAPRALIFQPLVKGNEALEERDWPQASLTPFKCHVQKLMYSVAIQRPRFHVQAT